MFKNPLKYQQGGAAPSQEEEKKLAAFIQWLPKRVKEFQGMQPEQIAQTLNGMNKTPEGRKQLQQLMMQFEEEIQGGSQAFRQGGKIHDFICKHAKGGKAGCGCKKQEGGSFSEAFTERYQDQFNNLLQKNQSIDPSRPIGYPHIKEDSRFRNYSQQLPPAEISELYSKYNNFPNKILYSINPKIMNNKVYGPEENIAGMEDGGMVKKVEKHQDANGKVGVTRGRYQASDWENEFDQFTPTPGGGYARNYRLPVFGGHRWGIPGNTLRQVLITYDENGIPRKAVRDLEGYYGNGRIDTVFYDARGNTRNSRDFEARVNRELAGMDPHQRPMEKEKCGGKVKK